MKLISLGLFFLAFAGVAAANPGNARICPAPWLGAENAGDDCSLRAFHLSTASVLTGEVKPLEVFIRSGYLPENPAVPFRGNVIYYEGLADSMLNHRPLFDLLTEAGFRVIAFDYMGQGGSGGSMDDTRIREIIRLGDQVWRLYARDLAQFPGKNIIGWSTGGLAAYVQAQHDSHVKNVVLQAPGIAPNYWVGEQDPKHGRFGAITIATLTTQKYGAGIYNPHIDAQKPASVFEVKNFDIDLFKVAVTARNTLVPPAVNGFVLLSGEKDTYVSAPKTIAILERRASQFVAKRYAGTLHEIDNEAEPQASGARADILAFLLAHP